MYVQRDKEKIKNIYLQHNGMCIHIRKKKNMSEKKKGKKNIIYTKNIYRDIFRSELYVNK